MLHVNHLWEFKGLKRNTTYKQATHLIKILAYKSQSMSLVRFHCCIWQADLTQSKHYFKTLTCIKFNHFVYYFHKLNTVLVPLSTLF